MNIRRMVNAGSWYPRDKQDLLNLIHQFIKDSEFGPGRDFETKNLEQRKAIGGVSPHAGLFYSGACATCTYFSLFEEKVPDSLIVIGFDHRRYYPNCLFEEGEWETPLGNLVIDSELAKGILNTSRNIVSNNSAFIESSENSIELQMPIIKFFTGENDVKIVPIKLSSHDFSELENIAKDLAIVIQNSSKDIVIVASSDLYHEGVYDKHDLENFKKKDEFVIENFEKLNPEKIFNLGMQATVCGRHTITLLLLIGNELNAKEGICLKHYTSVDKTKEYGYCVGYFSGVLRK